MKKWNLIGTDLTNVVNSAGKELGKGSGHESGPEDVDYFARQIVNRMQEIQNNEATAGEDGPQVIFSMHQLQKTLLVT